MRSFTADSYNISIRSRVALTENLTGAAVVSLLIAQGITGQSPFGFSSRFLYARVGFSF